MQITIDVPFGPKCVYGRCFDYVGLADFVDFFFIMDYDESGANNAGPNSGYQQSMMGRLQTRHIMSYASISSYAIRAKRAI